MSEKSYNLFIYISLAICTALFTFGIIDIVIVSEPGSPRFKDFKWYWLTLLFLAMFMLRNVWLYVTQNFYNDETDNANFRLDDTDDIKVSDR